MIDMQTALAFHRFGLGARPGDMARLQGARLQGSARAALLDEARGAVEPSPFAGMLSSADLLVRFMDFRGERQAVRREVASRAAGETGLPPPPSVQVVEQALANFTAAGKEPLVAAQRILAGVRAGAFYIPTSDAYAEQVAVVSAARQARLLPPFQMLD